MGIYGNAAPLLNGFARGGQGAAYGSAPQTWGTPASQAMPAPAGGAGFGGTGRGQQPQQNGWALQGNAGQVAGMTPTFAPVQQPQAYRPEAAMPVRRQIAQAMAKPVARPNWWELVAAANGPMAFR